jgi:hypothetical protein
MADICLQTQSVKLEGWAVVAGENRGGYEELRPGNVLVGRAYGHQKIKTGMFMFSSPIVRVNAQRNLVETRNTSYQLGEASPDYKAWSGPKTPRGSVELF